MDEAAPVNHPHNWLGDDIGYHSLHKYLRDHYPKTGICDECASVAATEFALIKGRTYSRKREDYRELCRPCHGRYDLGGVTLSQETRARQSAGKKRWWDEQRPPGPVPWIKRGEAATNARLTEEIVRDCRRRVRAGESIRSLARGLGVNRELIRDAVRGKTWAHIEGAVPP